MTRYAFRDAPKAAMAPGLIKRELRTLKVTQKAVAEWLGVSQSTVNYWMSNTGPSRLVDRKHTEAILIAARCIAKGILVPSQAILDTLEWQYGEGRGDYDRTAPKARPDREVAHHRIELEGLRKQIARLEKALEFYADHTHYMLDGPAVRRGAIYHRPVMDDGGTIARKALGEKGER